MQAPVKEGDVAGTLELPEWTKAWRGEHSFSETIEKATYKNCLEKAIKAIVKNVVWQENLIFTFAPKSYCSLVTFREAFFEQSSQKTRDCGAKSCECMISVRGYCERSEQ